MRIKTFCKFVEVSELTPRTLRDEPVVVDGHNLFYSSYQRAGLTTAFGIEADRYARYLSKYLTMFKKANVKCYFLFKGGHEDMEKRLKKNKDSTIVPVLMKETYKQVLKKMDFEYVVCEYESKKDLVELAEKLNCPIISYDIDNCFTGLQYIPYTTLKLQSDNSIQCGYFLLETFLRKHNLTVDKLAVFVVLTDEKIFPEGFFLNFFKNIKAPLIPFERNLHLLRWLSKKSKQELMTAIFKFVPAEDKKTFVEEEAKARQLIGRRETGGLGAACMLDRGAGRVARVDPRWFAKGVAAGHIAIEYVNLYRSKVVYGASPITGFDNPILISLDIIYYAYDLLTDFDNDGFTLIYENDSGDKDKQTMKVVRTHSVSKPAYEAGVCVFENGWDSVASLGLLEHFARSVLQLASLRRLERAPKQARLLLLALAYCSRRSPAAPAALPAAVLLTHVMLDVRAYYQPKFPSEHKPILDSTTERSKVTNVGCGTAAAIIKKYCMVNGVEKTNLNLLHSLAEFQQCLLQLLALNALCGAELRAPALARTFNGTLAYNLLSAADRSPDYLLFLRDLMNPAPTVYAYFIGLLKTYEDISIWL